MQKIGVIGLGLNGLLSAISARKAGFEVEAFENIHTFEMYENDNRTTLLTLKTINFFKEIEIFEKLQDFLSPIFHIYTFEEGASPVLSFDSEKPYGFVVPNNILKKTLYSEIQALKITIHNENIKESYEDGPFIKVLSENEKKYKLLLNCSGKATDISRKSFPYNQAAFVFNIKHSLSHRNIAIESFSPGGVLAILPLLSETESAVIWNVGENAASFLQELTETDFLKAFQDKTKRMQHIGEILEITTIPKSYPLSLSFATPQNRNRTFLIGDIYNTIHPVAGQAFNMSVKDIKNLYFALKEASRLGLDVGSFTFLSSLKRKNLKHHLEMNIFTHLVIKTFTSKNGILKILRLAGIKALEELPSLKRIIAREAGGLN